ncbi:sporulation related protein [Pseudodesulfovibrio indicus]|uniref:Sporulation protein n=2 Tax=Pseudodesulfovibrio indicus TaxID=1716143 RepID=A0A140D994_9BACT|nr:SPOR domain-containing protein [Pseudodesulfovibrio indicus]AMK09761.1 sporulation protein [Pseudodesulfovibrio indicus]TDT86278.1 sporulation related protein [Pseudodesulfovibrio indicus]
MPDNMEPKYKVKVPKLNADKRKIEFSMSLPGFITATGVGVLALTFFFVMGILIGRGYRPESDVPPLGQIMPGAEHGELAQANEPPKVLTSEELDYQERLQVPPQQMLDTPVPAAKPEPKPEAKPEPKPEPAPAAKAEPAAPEQAAKPAPAAPGETVFDYVYQVASFRKEEMARSLNDQLTAAGLSTRIESGEAKGSTWHRVQVLHRGTPASTGDMKAVLAKFGIQKPLLKKKTAVQ